MNSPRFGLRVASVISGLLCAAHVVRLIAAVRIQIGSVQIDLWPSGFAIVVAAALCGWFWQLSRMAGSPPPAA